MHTPVVQQPSTGAEEGHLWLFYMIVGRHPLILPQPLELYQPWQPVLTGSWSAYETVKVKRLESHQACFVDLVQMLLPLTLFLLEGIL